MKRLAGIAALPLFWISLSFTIGVSVGSFWLPAAWFCWVSAGLGVINSLLIGLLPRLPVRVDNNRKIYAITALSLAALALGILRYRADQPDFTPADLAYYNQLGRVSVIGVVSQDPDVRDTYTQVHLQVEQLTLTAGGIQIPVEGILLAYLPRSDWRYGDRLYISGELLTPPAREDFSYRAYLARWDIHSYMPYAYADRLESGQGSLLKTWIYSFKQSALELLYRYLPDPEASLAAGILLGVESGIPDKVELAFQETGTTHIIAISGFNITIVAGLFAILFERLLGPRRGAVVAVIGISIYTLLVGADPPVVRAAIMGGLSLFARQVGRRQDGINSLSFTAAVMLAFNPLLLWDAGFQLSFAATLGLILYAEPWTAALEGWFGRRFPARTSRNLAAPISEYFLLTIAAQLTTLPILLYHFQRISWVSLPANLLILPAQPPIMILGGISVLLGVIFAPLGQLCAYLVWPFVAYTIRVVEWIASFNQVRAIGQVSIAFVIGYYLILLFATTSNFEKIKGALPKIKPLFALVGLLVVVLLVWQAALAAPDGCLHVTIMDVGEGAAILIQTPEGRYLLIGGGSSTIRLSDSLGRLLPLFHRKLDLLIVPSTEKQYVSALPEVAARFPPTQVYWSGEPDTSRASEELYSQLSDSHLKITPVSPGAVIDLGADAQLKVIDFGENGIVLRLEWREFQMVFPFNSDYQNITLDQFSRQTGGRANVVLLSGSAVENTPWSSWFSAFNPALIVVSQQSADGLYSEFRDQDLPILSTDRVGWVQLSTDGISVWIQVEDN
ncbi:MAG: ComEC/Rec2 family competence protein [Chloroflexota bacterium]